MSTPTSRIAMSTLGLLVALGLAVSVPVAAASTPMGAVEALVERVQASQFDALDDVVCAAEQDAVRALFDIGGQLGDTPGVDGEQFMDAFTITLDDVAIELLSEEGDAARARLQGQMTVSMDPAAAELFVLSVASVFDEDVSDEDLAVLVGSLMESFTEPRTLDEEIVLIREDGEWLVCDPLGQPSGGVTPVDDGSSVGGQVSFEGLCGLVTLDEVNATSTLVYDSSAGFEDQCSYFNSSIETFFTLTATTLAGNLDSYASTEGGFEEVLVGDQRGLIADDILYSALADGGTLVTSLFVDDAEALSLDLGLELDPRQAMIALAELIGPIATSDSTDEPGADDGSFEALTSEGSLCELVDIDALNAIGPLQYDDVFDGGTDLCVYSATVPEQGFHTLSIFTEFFSLDELIEVYEGGAGADINGSPTYAFDGTLWVEVGDRVMAISPLFDDLAVDAGTDELGFAAQVAELVVAAAADDG